jgi:chaperonin cofactor prefoldin
VRLFEGVRSLAANVAQGAGRAALAAAPGKVQDTVARVRARYEAGRVDAQRALEELAALEEQAVMIATRIVLFPWATAGAIREIYGRVRELERSLDSREEKIKALEARIQELENGQS